MAITTAEAQARILDELGVAIREIALAVACLGAAHEQLDVGTADRLEEALFRPAQRAYARAKRTHAGFASRSGIPEGGFDAPSPGPASQGARGFIERAATAATNADRKIAELQDTMLPVESGDPELRAGLAEVRELLAPAPVAARDLLRTFGR